MPEASSQRQPSTGLPVAVILAGGASSRMGSEKALMPLAGRPMLAHVMERIAPQAASTVLSANGNPARFAAFGLPVVADAIGGGLGPLAGLHAGMRWALDRSPATRCIVSVPADTPLLPDDLVARLLQAGADDRVVLAASSGGTHGTVGLWPVSLAAELAMFLTSGESPKVLVFAGRHRAVLVGFADRTLGDGRKADPFLNINTPGEAVVAGAMLGGS